jgi:hypothetical protein
VDIRPIAPQQHHGRALPDELQQDLNLNQPVHELPEREEAERDGHRPDRDQRHVRKVLGRVYACKDGEELAVTGGGEWNPRVAEHDGIERRAGDEQDQAGHHDCRDLSARRIVERPRNEQRCDSSRVLSFLPRDHTENHRAHRHIQCDDGDDRQHDGARDRARRRPHFFADVADIVVSAVVVHRDQSRRADCTDEARVHPPRRRRKVERARPREMQRAGDDDPAERREHDDEHYHRKPADRSDVAIEERRHGDADRGRDQVVLHRRHRRPVETQVVGESDRPARNRQRRHEHHLKDEDERHQPPEPERPIRFAKVDVRAAAARQRRAELRVHEAVAQREHRAKRPGVEDVRPVHCRHHERDREKRADAHHADDVRRRGLQQAEAAIEPHHSGDRAATRRAAISRLGTSGFDASASRAASTPGDDAAAIVRRSYSFTRISSGRTASGTGPT